MAAAKTGRTTLAEVARFDHQVTGVTVAEDGRIFVNFPRWSEDAAVSVAELPPDGSLAPYPDARWNEWRNARKNELSPGDRWVCVQSVVADGRGSLWVLDPAAPATSHLVPGGAKLVQVDLATNTVRRTVSFDEQVAPEGSYLNDVRFSPDGRWAYITDSGAVGALVVVDLEGGTSRRVLHKHPSTQPEKDVVVTIDGRPLRRPDGRGAEFAADGIALSRDGRHLYWQALTGHTLYRIEASALQNPTLDDATLAAQVEPFGANRVSDGLWIDAAGRMYLTALEENAVKVRDLADGPGGAPRVLVRDDARLRWPDTFSEGPDGTIYVSASHIMDMPWYAPDHPPQVRTALFRVEQRA